jgi:hypothetical protein
MEGTCSVHEETRDEYKILVRNLEGKRQFGRRGHKWENIKVVCDGRD